MITIEQEREIKNIVKNEMKSLLMAATNKQIYQFPPNSSPALTDLVPQSDESAAHETVQSDWQHILDLFKPELDFQSAYNAGNIINLTPGRPFQINSTDSDGNKPLIIGNDKGIQIQAPIYSLLASNLNLAPDLSGTIFQNSASVISNTVTLITNGAYAQNTAIFAWANGTQTLFITAQAGTTIDGIDAASLTVLPGQFWAIYQININVFKSINLQPIAEDGIEYTNGVLRLTGSGASSAYNYTSIGDTGGSSYIAFVDQGHYFIPFALDPATNGVTRGTNLAFYSDGNRHIGIQNIGTETGVFTLLLNCQFEYSPENINSASNNYEMCGNINLAAGPDGSFAPIDLIPVPYSSKSDKRFTIFPNYHTTVIFPVQVQLAPLDVFYPNVRNAGPTNDASLNRIIMTSYSYTSLKVGDTGGLLAGVASLNSLTGNANLVSPDSSIQISVDALNNEIKLITNLVGAPFSPVLTNVQGASASAMVSAIYNAKTFSCKMTLTATTDNSDALVKVNFPLPVAVNALEGCVVSVIKTSLLDSGGGTATGSGRPLILIDPTTAQIIFEGSERATSYTVSVFFDIIRS